MRKMKIQTHKHSPIAFVELLKACAMKKDLHEGVRLHAHILEHHGLLQKSPHIATTLISMYAKCGAITKARQLFWELPVRDVVSWNALIAGYAQQGQPHEVFNLFERMRKDSLSPDGVTFTCILNACSSIGALDKGKEIHDEIVHRGLLERNIMLGNALVDMYAKCGMFAKARRVLEELRVRNVVTWNALIAGYVQHGQGHEALESVIQMQKEGVAPDGVTFVCILKSCGSTRDIDKGRKIHDEIVSRCLLEKNIVLGNALVDMYAKCGHLTKAAQVLEELPVRNVVSWSTLISGYVQAGKGNEALNCFALMQREGISPNRVTFSSILKACGITGAIEKGKQIHEEVVNKGLLQKSIMLGNALVDMYAKCGDLSQAKQVLEELSLRDIFSWSALIAGYAQEGQGHEALNCFGRMQKEGLSPDGVTFILLLKACASIGAIDKGRQIHDEIVNRGLLNDNIVLGTALVDMYAKCGILAKAQEVLEALPVRNAVSWCALIAGYTQKDQPHEALNCFEKMQKEGLSPDGITFISILKACGSIGALEKGEQIHEEIVKRGLLEKNIALGNVLVDMYAKCGALVKAQQVLEDLHVRDIVSWNSLIAGYAQHGQGSEVLDAFERLQQEGLFPDCVTFACILKACGNTKAVDKGSQIHEEIVGRGFLKSNTVLGTAIVDMYAKGGVLTKARKVLEELPIRDTGSWSALIAGYAQAGQGHEALNCFEQMLREGLSPNEATLISILKACSSIGASGKGKQIHDEIVRRGLLENNILLGNVLVDMYAKCGLFAKAKEVLEGLPIRNVVSWNSLIAAYAEKEEGHEALDCFSRMHRDGLHPNDVTFTCMLKACGSIGAIDKGKQIHDDVISGSLLEKNVILGNALVDMYAKCGMLAKAQEVLENLCLRDTISWSTMIAGYAQEGYSHQALRCFEQMQREGLCANEVTFLSLLNACNHAGKLDEAQTYYETMSRTYGITPTLEHHVCMVVVFGCAGCLDKAMSIIKTMPYSNDPSVWLALLSACRKWENVKLGRFAFSKVIELDNNLPAAYVLMANIYIAAGMQEDAEEVENMRVKNAVCTKPCRSCGRSLTASTSGCEWPC